MMSRTCKKFFTMVNGLSRFKNYEKHMKQVFIMKTDLHFFANFRSNFKIFFLNHFSGYANYLQMQWFLSIIYEHLNERVLFAHVYFVEEILMILFRVNIAALFKDVKFLTIVSIKPSPNIH